MNYKKLLTVFLTISMSYVLISNMKIITNYSKGIAVATAGNSEESVSAEVEGDFKGSLNFKPGDLIEEDKITLVNNENYPIKFSLELMAENKIADIDLLSKLNLKVIGAEEVSENSYEVVVWPLEREDIYSNVSWNHGYEDYKYASSGVDYTYKILAEKSPVVFQTNFNKEDAYKYWVNTLKPNEPLMATFQDGEMIVTGDIKTEFDGSKDKFPKNGFTVETVVNISRLGIQSGFDYAVALNNNKGEFLRNFSFHLYKNMNGITYLYFNDDVNSKPLNYGSVSKQVIIPDGELKFSHKFYNEDGIIKCLAVAFDKDNNEIYKDTYPRRNDLVNKAEDVGGYNRGRFGAILSNNELIVKSVKLIIN